MFISILMMNIRIMMDVRKTVDVNDNEKDGAVLEKMV